MTKPPFPLGHKEDDRLELKARDALKAPSKIARAVVAFLNAKGGDVWVGVAESEGGIAASIEGIENPEQARRALWDHLVETIEPSPTVDEIRVETVEPEAGRFVFRIRVEPDETRRPYAQLCQGGRFFVARIGDRIRPMTREEIFSLASGKGKDKKARSGESIERIRTDLRERQERSAEGLWVRVEPVPALEVELEDEDLEEWLTDPERTGNRRMGWNFAVAQERPVHRTGRLVQGLEGYARVEIHETGALVFTASLSALRHGERDRVIYPYPLMEYPTSVLRLASVLFGRYGKNLEEVFADLAILGCRGWQLRPFSPKAIGHHGSRGIATVDEEKDLVWERPLRFTRQEVMETPDRCAYRLVLRLYHAFGYDADQVPHEFDPKTGRLVLPS